MASATHSPAVVLVLLVLLVLFGKDVLSPVRQILNFCEI
jgi:hypothetical protein